MIMSRNFVKIITSPCILEIPIAKQIKQEQLKMKKKKRGTAFNTTYNNAIYVKNINISYELAFQCFVN